MVSASSPLAVRVDGNGHIGLGHLFRCLHLAAELRTAGIETTFLVLESSLAGPVREFLERDGWRWRIVSGSNPWRQDDDRLRSELRGGGFAVALIDLLIPDSGDDDLLANPEFRPADVPGTLALARGLGLKVAVMSDQYDRVRLAADVVFNTCPAQDPAWYADVTGTVYRLGPAYYLLPASFRVLANKPKVFRVERPKIGLFFGGNDHRNFTAPVVAALAPFRPRVEIEVIVGAATPDGARVAAQLERQGIKAHYRIPDVAPVLADADLLVLASGNTLFDAAALGVPAIALSTRERQRVTARYLAAIGSAIDAGDMDKDIWTRIAAAVGALAFDVARRRIMSEAGRRAVDGHGMNRAIDDIRILYH